MRYLIAVLVQVVLFYNLAYGAPILFLKDGTTVAASSIWTENNKVYLSKSKEIYEYSLDEVKLDETLKYNKLGRYQVLTPEEHSTVPGTTVSKQRRGKRDNVTPAAVRGGKHVAKPVAASATASTASALVPAVVKPMPKPVATPVPPTPAPEPTPAPAPTAQEPAPLAPADSASPPDKAELERRTKEATAMMTEAVMKNDPELMKKAIEMQKSATPQDIVRSKGRGARNLLLLLVISLIIVVSSWVIFEKAGHSGWKSLIPLYNVYILIVISDQPVWWFLLLFVPFVGTVFYLLSMISMAQKFGRSALFGVGLCFLPMFFFPVLAFGGSQYEG